jgi:hypothetical protein
VKWMKTPRQGADRLDRVARFEAKVVHCASRACIGKVGTPHWLYGIPSPRICASASAVLLSISEMLGHATLHHPNSRKGISFRQRLALLRACIITAAPDTPYSTNGIVEVERRGELLILGIGYVKQSDEEAEVGNGPRWHPGSDWVCRSPKLLPTLSAAREKVRRCRCCRSGVVRLTPL